MRPLSACALILAALGCATSGPVPATPGAPAPDVLRAPELARVRCLVVAPFENASDAPLAADAATGALLGGIDPSRARVLPIPELRAVFRDTALELPEGVPPSLALELAQLLGADAAIYGAVEGRTRDGAPQAVVTLRLALTGGRDLVWAETVPVRPAQGETIEAAVRRAVAGAAQPVLARLGAGGGGDCFPPERTQKLRALALADARPAPAPAPVPAPTRPAAPSASPPASAPVAAPAVPRARSAEKLASTGSPAPRAPRQAEWAKRIAAGGRFLVDDAAFEGRSPALARDGGLADLAAALQAVPGVRLRIEAYVDATSDAASDARLSGEMAAAAVARLVELGVPRERLVPEGRGGEAPILPNFTARGRAANRRIEAVIVR